MSSFSYEETVTRTVYLPERKDCGHDCCPSTVPKCCACSDLRPVLEGDVYPCYVDGEGWLNNEARDAGYCPICNPKNYEVWERRIALERIKKAEKKKELALLEEKALLLKEEDRQRAAAETTIMYQHTTIETKVFKYSNGDSYLGEMFDGLPHGEGIMSYVEGEEYSGQWKNGKHHGRGDKNWGDGITYSGEWKNDMMHGEGHYIMADGTEVKGIFAEDEFVE